MRKRLLSIFTILTFTLLGAAVLVAQEKPAAEPAQGPAKAEKGKAKAGGSATLGPAETFSGTVAMVDTDKHLLVAKDSDGVPLDFGLSHATKITSGGKKVAMSDLSAASGKQVSVKFVPTRKGNRARSVDISE